MWRGSPMSIDYPTLTGRLSLDLENGQILSVDPGAARLLGVLSLQGLLRFATLDFRTLSGRGLLFDRIAGSGTIENGVGTIHDFQLKSPQIIASMTGSANLLRETQDLDVHVVPRINATTTSVAAAFINPVLGIAPSPRSCCSPTSSPGSSPSTTASAAAGPPRKSAKWRTIRRNSRRTRTAANRPSRAERLRQPGALPRGNDPCKKPLPRFVLPPSRP